MTGTSSWNAPVACAGLAAYIGMLFRFPLLVQMVQAGEIAILSAVPTVLGALLLLVACFGMLLKRPVRGWLFAIAAITLLIGLIRLPTLVFSFWLWLAVVVAVTGTVIGFRSRRRAGATD